MKIGEIGHYKKELNLKLTIDAMKTASPDQILTESLRIRLKEIMRKEIESLPETMAALNPKERINVICKLMPFIFPKVESVLMSEGEPNSW